MPAANGVNVTEATDTYESETKETHGSAELSVVVQHQAVEVVKAAIAVEKAKDDVQGGTNVASAGSARAIQLEKAKKDYKAYERNLDQLKTQLTQLDDDYKNKVPGVQYDDVLELRDILKDAKGDKEWYQAGVALAAVNLATSIIGLVQQIVAAVQSTGTYGFNAGVQLGVADVAGDVMHVGREALPCLGVEGAVFGKLLNGVAHLIAKYVVGERSARRAQDREARGQAAVDGKPEQGGQQLAFGQVARCAEDNNGALRHAALKAQRVGERIGGAGIWKGRHNRIGGVYQIVEIALAAGVTYRFVAACEYLAHLLRGDIAFRRIRACARRGFSDVF